MLIIKINSIAISLIVWTVITTGVYCQSNVPRIYIHTDRAAYFPGDTVWFKGYVLNESLLDSSVVNLYIDWADSQNAVFDNSVYLAAGGITPGQFVIPLDYAHASLQLNAFTSNIASHRHLAYYKNLSILLDSLPIGSMEKQEKIAQSSAYVSSDRPIKLTIDAYPDTIKMLIRAEHAESYKDLKLECRLQHDVIFIQEIDLDGHEGKIFKLPRAGLGYGILQMKIFDRSGQLIARQANMLFDSVQLVTPEITISETDEISIALPIDEAANLSLSITRPEAIIEKGKNIVSEILLNTMAKNTYPKFDPWRLHNDTIASVVRQDWRWKDGGEDIPFITDSVLYLKGQLIFNEKTKGKFKRDLNRLRNRKGEQMKGLSLGYRPVRDTLMRYMEVPFDRDYKFEAPTLTFFDSLSIRTTQIEQLLKFTPFDVNYTFYPLNSATTIHVPSWHNPRADMQEQNISADLPIYDESKPFNRRRKVRGAIEIEEVVVRRNVQQQRIEQLEKEHHITGPFASHNSISFDLDNDPNSMGQINVYTYLLGKIPSVEVIIGPKLIDGYFRNRRGGDIRLYLNEVPCSNEDLGFLDLTNVSYIKYFYPPSVLNPSGGGVLVVYTKKGFQFDRSSAVEVDNRIVMGYVEPLAKEIDTDALTVYWYPLLLLTEDNPRHILHIKKGLIPGTTITIEGVTQSGKFVYLQKEIK